MKTLCSFDNVACIVDNLALSIDGVAMPAIIIGTAIVLSYIVASVVKGN
jgi:hypothetical protein